RFAPPRDGIEAALADLWRDLLRRPAVRASDDFFDLGGHSLLAAQLAARVRDLFGVELPLRTLFEAPTLEALANHIRLGADPAAPAPRPLPPLPPGAARPLSSAQQRLWFLAQLEAPTPLYTVFPPLRARGPLAPIRLERAMRELALRHDVLRPSFARL